MKFSYIIFLFLKIIDKIVYFIFKRSFLIHFGDYINKDFNKKIEINNKETILFIPNYTVKWRVETIFSKEPETLEWIDTFKAIDNKTIIFWDIGANIGLYSIYAAQKINNIKIYSFEPSTSNLRVLSRNIFLNNLSEKISISQFPLTSKKNVFLDINESEFIEGWSMNSFGTKKGYDGEEIKVKQKYKIFGTSIDNLVENEVIELPNYVKIDVDGIEDLILEGAKKILSNKTLKSLSIELNENYEHQYNKIIKMMESFGFKLKQKKHDPIYDNNEKFSKIYNCIFSR
tara:strand:+ start:344 stop:1204 length:861 start_codon:yes stop_codon:yes gene_type:complete